MAYSEGQRGEASSGVPDNGYSSWVELPDGSVYFVDYTNHGDPAPFGHLYGAVLTPDDFSRLRLPGTARRRPSRAMDAARRFGHSGPSWHRTAKATPAGG